MEAADLYKHIYIYIYNVYIYWCTVLLTYIAQAKRQYKNDLTVKEIHVYLPVNVEEGEVRRREKSA